MATTITAAETGHLILSTLHTSDVAQAVHRIIDVFPGDQQAQVRHQLSLSLNAIVCQQLVPSADGRARVPAVEVLHATYAVRNHIRRRQSRSDLQRTARGPQPRHDLDGDVAWRTWCDRGQ